MTFFMLITYTCNIHVITLQEKRKSITFFIFMTYTCNAHVITLQEKKGINDIFYAYDIYT